GPAVGLGVQHGRAAGGGRARIDPVGRGRRRVRRGDLRARGMRRWLLTPAALVLLEALQQRFPFGGFPLPSFAVTQVDGPLLSAAPVGGSLMVTGLAAVLGAALLALVLRPGLRARSVAAATASGVFLLPLSLAELSMGDRAGSLDAVVVQGGGPRGLRA